MRLIAVLLVLVGCGEESVPKRRATPTPFTIQGLKAEDYTPGFFRNAFRLLESLRKLDNGVAVARIKAFASDPDPALPPLLEEDAATLSALLTLTQRAIIATSDDPTLAGLVGAELIEDALGLDPALDAQQLEPRLPPGAATLAREGLWTLQQLGGPALCLAKKYATASWDPGDAEVVWVEEVCEPDRYAGGYCEQDTWVEGDCYEEWVPEACSGGGYVDKGRYEYICYSSDDCRYVWRAYWVYEDGDCTGGYYDEWCESGYYEDGLCYDGTFVPGYCEPGHYEYRFPGGTWTFANYVTAPAACEIVAPREHMIGVTVLGLLQAHTYADLEPQWAAALDALLADHALAEPTPALRTAIDQVLKAVAASDG